MKRPLSIIAAAGVLLTLAATPSPAQLPTLPRPEQVGEVVPMQLESGDFHDTAGSAVAVAWYHEITLPGASYVAPHFSRFDLPRGAELVVRAPDSSRSWSYSGQGKPGLGIEQGFWGIHIPGETAVLELRSSVSLKRGAVVVDRVARGFPGASFSLTPRSVCGTDDTQEAKCYQGSEPTIYSESRAVARLLINGTSLCTGWLVGDQGHLFTNNHCIGSASAALNTDYEFDAEGSSCSTNCQSTLGCPGVVEATSATLIQTDAALDYTLVQLPTNVSSTYGFMQLRASGPTLGERIYLPGHPAGWGKRIGVESTHASNPSGVCEVDGLSEPSCSGTAPEVGYYCDTRGGSSGSPVLAYSDHCVVALHHCRGNVACTGTGGDPNRGLHIDDVIADLGGNLPGNALCGAPPAGGFQGGNETIDEQVRTVGLSGFTSPVVVMGPPSFNGSHPSTIRVNAVTATGFEHYLQEWDYLDGNHANESIGYLALEAGTGSVGSLTAEAGTVNINHNWTTVSFSASFSSAPVVIAQVATVNGGQAVTTRVNAVTASGFEIRLQEEEGNDGTHAVETVHWIAVETGTTTVDGNTFIAALTPNSVTHNWFTIGFSSSLSSPVFLAEMQTFNGNNPAALRHRNLSGSSVEVKVEEEQSLDAEVGHVSEVVGYLAFSQ